MLSPAPASPAWAAPQAPAYLELTPRPETGLEAGATRDRGPTRRGEGAGAGVVPVGGAHTGPVR